MTQHSLFGSPRVEPELPRAHPFIKWVGGKRQLLPAIATLLPKLGPSASYHEPFLGGAALFFHLAPERAFLADTNARLVRMYRAIRDNPEEVVKLLKTYPHDKAFFNEMRAMDIDVEGDVEVAAWFIFLNRTCFNGLYRVNKKGVFNVPFGRHKNPTICDEQNLLACSRALKAAVIFETCDFERALELAVAGDLAYLDPPYVPLSSTSNFTGYTSDGFTDADQVRLYQAALRAKQRGVTVILSNSSAPRVFEIYREGFSCMEVDAKRALSCDGAGRGAIKELLIF